MGSENTDTDVSGDCEFSDRDRKSYSWKQQTEIQGREAERGSMTVTETFKDKINRSKVSCLETIWNFH